MTVVSGSILVMSREEINRRQLLSLHSSWRKADKAERISIFMQKHIISPFLQFTTCPSACLSFIIS